MQLKRTQHELAIAKAEIQTLQQQLKRKNANGQSLNGNQLSLNGPNAIRGNRQGTKVSLNDSLNQRDISNSLKYKPTGIQG